MLIDHDEDLTESEAKPTKDSRLNLRISSRQAQLLRRAAAAEDQSVTDFVLRSAALEAERVLADRRWFIFTEQEWDAFNQALNRPTADFASVRDLMHDARSIDLSDL